MHLCAGVCYKEFKFRKERLIYCLLSEICKISTTKDNRQYAHAWDYCTLTKGNNIPLCVGYCLLFGSRYCRTSDKTTFNSSHAFSFTQVLTVCFWETVSSKKVCLWHFWGWWHPYTFKLLYKHKINQTWNKFTSC